MIDFDFDKYCYGCTACANECPYDAIVMSPNVEGFLMPSVDMNKCVNCHLCERVCPHLQKKDAVTEDSGTWLYSSQNKEAKLKSSSGGAFYELAINAVDDGFHIGGCIWDENLVAKHIISSDYKDIIRMQGSKYVQSDMGSCLHEISKLLKSGNKVLFSGTPCQATAAHLTAMRLAKGRYRENLITVAVICHGVSTPKAWLSYKKWVEKNEGSRMIAVNFRNKDKQGYKKSYCRYDFESGAVTYLPTYLPSSPYMESTIVYNLAMRHSCNHCECKGLHEGCDIIIGDWYECNTGEGALGTSCIVASTNRGKNFIEHNLQNLRSFDYCQVVQKNGFVEKSADESPNRKQFFQKLEESDFWNHVETLYPSKYRYKKLLVKMGLYDKLKKVIG